MIVTPARGVVWSNISAKAPTEQADAMRHAGRMFYTPLKVFGGSCVWIGDKWVLAARHGVEKWSKHMLSVDFPAHGEQRYPIQAIHSPLDDKVDLALLELTEPLAFDNPVTIETRELRTKAKVIFGGYGSYGPAGKIAGANRFHWGTNTLDSANTSLARFSLGKPNEADPREALPATFDSGSPVFIQDGEQKLLVGVVIRVSNGSSPKIGDRATITCVAQQVEWIKHLANNLKWRN